VASFGERCLAAAVDRGRAADHRGRR
jgi:hypothetical protein